MSFNDRFDILQLYLSQTVGFSQLQTRVPARILLRHQDYTHAHAALIPPVRRKRTGTHLPYVSSDSSISFVTYNAELTGSRSGVGRRAKMRAAHARRTAPLLLSVLND
jgi:hypothetical protein